MIEPKKIEALLFATAAEIPDRKEREMFLEWACREEPELRVRLEKLLSVKTNAEDYFDFEPFDPAVEDDGLGATAGGDDTEEIGLKIGNYRLIRRLGEGGYGVVYLAEQEAPVQRQVALKLIRVEIDHEGMIARFEAERQTLAMMDHPDIAKVLDAGSTATGRPYFVMQWVAGEPITDFCDHHRLTVPQRLELFIKVCRAVQHAHQKGVIHRDLKPTNVLTSMHDGLPAPKVIDFGIAMAAGGPMGLEESNSEQDYVIGTPNYMSPEQGERGGVGADTRSDVFSLGVLLCELLTGKTPFRWEKAERMRTVELRQNLSLRRPLLPSTILESYAVDELAVVGGNRSCSPQQLKRMVQGDLDAIVMKCLEQERRDRYASVYFLATEIQRHLDHEPVSACPNTRRYRLAKLIRRNRLTFFTGVVVVITLAAGFGTSTWLLMREMEGKRERERLREFSETARKSESNLRALADAGSTSARAAVEISYGELAQADELLARVPANLIPSSLEAANSYLAVGDWHRQAGRWPQAAARYAAVVEALSGVDSRDSGNTSYHLLRAVGAACAASDWELYERLRRFAIDRFAGSTNPDVADQILRAVLIRPVDEDKIRALTPIAELELTSPNPTGQNHEVFLSAWRCFSLALWYYRTGDFDQATQWGWKSLEIESRNRVRVPTVKLVLAMVAQRSGRADEARTLLSEASPPIREAVSENLNQHVSQRVAWFDWLIAGALLEEAEGLIGR